MKLLLTFFLTLLTFNTFATTDSLFKSVTIGGYYSQGNINSSSFELSSELSGYNTKHNWTIMPTFRYIIYNISPSNSSVCEQNEFYSVQNYTFNSNNNLKMLFFSEVEHSLNKKIDLRTSLGFGASYKLKTKSLPFEITISEVLLPDYFKRSQIKSTSIQAENVSFRSSTRIKFLYKINENITFVSVNMIQPALYTRSLDNNSTISTKDNTIFRSSNQLDFLIKKGLSIGFSLDYVNESYLQYLIDNQGVVLSPSDLNFSFYLKLKK